MHAYTENLGALIGSRICHDLISPVGAITNGLELLEMSGAPRSPEMALVSESAVNASALIRLFRIAFGLNAGARPAGGDEMAGILRAIYRDSRIRIEWGASGEFSRDTAQAVMLAALCADRALAFGGTMRIVESDGHWQITAEAPRLSADPALWALLSGSRPQTPLTPADVQFALLPQFLASRGKGCRHTITAKTASLGF